jgi:hypothetical protein
VTLLHASYVGADQRQAPRSDVYARVTVTLPDGRGAMVTIVNISADGLLMRFDGQIAEGAAVGMSLPVIGKIAGFAVWSVGGRTGVQFNESIAEHDYMPLLRALGGRLPDSDTA